MPSPDPVFLAVMLCAFVVFAILVAIVFAVAARLVYTFLRFPNSPGSKLLSLALVLPRTCAGILEDTVADLQNECSDLLAENRRWAASGILLQGYWSFWAALVAQSWSLTITAVLRAFTRAS